MTESNNRASISERLDDLRWDIVNAGFKKASLSALDEEIISAVENPFKYDSALMRGLDLLSMNRENDPFHVFSNNPSEQLRNASLAGRIFLRWYRAGHQDMLYRFSKEEILQRIESKLQTLQQQKRTI